ncbi:uncharacterized protein LOC134697919 [Mytilus trossulus]|uniref:uncharacterized protein LOC134697919 n=1 Tax=Mytilus trossulus TaxID=6551 RepID=UPI00300405F6
MFHITTVFVFIIIRKTYCSNITVDCYKTDTHGEKNFFCCDNTEKKNGTCTECAVGYYSKAGLPCEKCRYKAYGPKCVENCDCTVEQCNHVRGCISEFSSNESASVNATRESTIWLQTSSAYTEGSTERDTE